MADRNLGGIILHEYLNCCIINCPQSYLSSPSIDITVFKLNFYLHQDLSLGSESLRRQLQSAIISTEPVNSKKSVVDCPMKKAMPEPYATYN